MSLQGKKLQVMDTMELELVFKDPVTGASYSFGNGYTGNANLNVETSKTELKAGIGNKTIMTLENEKVMKFTATIKQFDAEFLALKNGVTLDKTSKNSFNINKEFSVSTNTATVSNVVRIINVKDQNGNTMKIVNTAPAQNDEVQVAIVTKTATLTLKTGSGNSKVFVTYEYETTKDNMTIKFYGNTFAQACELIGKTVAYDQDTSTVIADIFVDFWNAKIDSAYSIDFTAGEFSEIPVEFSIQAPSKKPDGTLNAENAYGAMVITER